MGIPVIAPAVLAQHRSLQPPAIVSLCLGASAITFLASAAASYVNGAHIRVDGGLGASNGNPHLA